MHFIQKNLLESTKKTFTLSLCDAKHPSGQKFASKNSINSNLRSSLFTPATPFTFLNIECTLTKICARYHLIYALNSIHATSQHQPRVIVYHTLLSLIQSGIIYDLKVIKWFAIPLSTARYIEYTSEAGFANLVSTKRRQRQCLPKLQIYTYICMKYSIPLY